MRNTPGVVSILVFGPSRLDCSAIATVNGLMVEPGSKTSVTALLREPKGDPALSDSEIEELIDDGVTIMYQAAVNRLFGEKNRLSAVEYIRTDTGRTDTVPAENLFLAAGRFPEMVFAYSETDDGTESEGMGN